MSPFRIAQPSSLEMSRNTTASTNRTVVEHKVGNRSPRIMYTTSAPTVLQSCHLDGVTTVSSQYLWLRHAQAATDSFYMGPGSEAVDRVTTIAMQLEATSTDSTAWQDYARTISWLNSKDAPVLVGAIQDAGSPTSDSNSASTSGLCDTCAAAKTTREVEALMRGDTSKTPPLDEDCDHYFPYLPDHIVTNPIDLMSPPAHGQPNTPSRPPTTGTT